MSELSNGIKKHTSKSCETIPLISCYCHTVTCLTVNPPGAAAREAGDRQAVITLLVIHSYNYDNFYLRQNLFPLQNSQIIYDFPNRNILHGDVISRVSEPHYFDAAPVPSKNFDVPRRLRLFSKTQKLS
jgi:hypothetical protein